MKFGNGVSKFLKFESKAKEDVSQLVSPDKSDELIQKATVLKNKGKHLDAIELLDLVCISGSDEFSQVAKYELGILYSQLGNHNLADKYLHDLGFRLKLSNSIWRHTNMDSPEDSCCKSVPIKRSSPVVAFNDILPAALLESLLTAFSSSSSFWSEHGYPTQEFFSYNVKTKVDQPSLMNQLVDYLTPLVNEHFPETKNHSKNCSTEWWCHMRDETSGFAHQLHFDLDEEALLEKSFNSKDLHPLVSAVLYLSDQNVAGPTLVTNQTLEKDSFATEGWLCHPCKNKLLLFDGKLLHGVVPYLPSVNNSATLEEGEAVAKSNTKSSPRITLMMGWWGKSFNDEGQRTKTKTMESNNEGTDMVLGPNMPMPTNSNSNSVIKSKNENKRITDISGISKSNPQWLTLMSPIDFGSISIRNKIFSDYLKLRNIPSYNALVHVDEPIWVPIGRNLRKRMSKEKIKSRIIKANKLCSKDIFNLRSRKEASIDPIEEKDDDNNDLCNTDKIDAVEFISIEELNKLRMGSNIKESEEKDDDDDVHNGSEDDESDSDKNDDDFGNAVEFISIAELNKLRTNSKSPNDSFSINGKLACDNKKDTFVQKGDAKNGRSRDRKKRKKMEGGEICFVGKWFLKSKFEIRDEILSARKKTDDKNGSNITDVCNADKSDAVDFISIEELNKLRMGSNTR